MGNKGRTLTAELEAMQVYGETRVGWDENTPINETVDADGNPDIVVTNFSREYNAVYKSTAGNLFSDMSPQIGLGRPSFPFVAWGTKFFDVDSDGDQDLFVANGHTYPQVEEREWDERYAQRNQLFLNTGSGRFRELVSAGPGLALARSGRGAAFGGLGNDGDVDVVISNVDDSPTILRNDTARKGHWLTIRLVGKSPNEPAIGARVTAVIPGRKLTREVRSGGSYLSQNDLRLHFGLGSAQRLDRLLVRWPDGRERVLEDVPVDCFLTVTRTAE